MVRLTPNAEAGPGFGDALIGPGRLRETRRQKAGVPLSGPRPAIPLPTAQKASVQPRAAGGLR